MVASALGLDTSRGDKIEVTSLPFLAAAEQAEAEAMADSQLYRFMPFIRYGLLLLGGLLLYFLMIRPLMKTLQKDVTQHFKTVEQMEAEQAQNAAAGRRSTAGGLVGGAAYKAAMESPPADALEKVKKGVDNDPVFSAHVLKNWIHEQS